MLVVEWNERAFIKKWTADVFVDFLRPYWCTKLYKGARNVSANNSETVSYKDLRLGQIVYILVFYKTSFPWLLPLDHDWTVSNLFFCCVTVKTIHMPKFRDRANWSRDTVEPIRRCAFVHQNIDQVLKIFFSQLQMEADRALLSRFCTISKKTFHVRE